VAWYFPDRSQLRYIVYNSSFAFRDSAGSESSSWLIRESRLAIAIVVVNRVKQRCTPEPGWGRGKRTEPADAITDPNYSLSVPGNRRADDECLAVAGEALALQNLPMDHVSLLGGANMYAHYDCFPPAFFGRLQGSRLVGWYGPMYSQMGERYLGVYMDRWWRDRAIRRGS
jgi:hypothetical protein